MNEIKKNFMCYIREGLYENAKSVSYTRLSKKEFYDFIIKLAFETSFIGLYTFVCFLLKEEESAYLHQLAAVLISQALSHIEGAYSSGLFHARRAVVLEPTNISHKEYLLLFYTIPDKLIGDVEAKFIAQEILKIDPVNTTALGILEDRTRFQSKN